MNEIDKKKKAMKEEETNQIAKSERKNEKKGVRKRSPVPCYG